MSIRLLCIADLHLGRAPSRIPLRENEFLSLSPREVLRRAAQVAIDRKVAAVVLTGDVIDESNAFFEAYNALAQTIAELAQADIPAVAVSGNHDFDSLPNLAKELPGLTLLGRGGRWEDFILEENGRALLRIVGRSFTAKHEEGNPLLNFTPPQDGIPTVGLLHADVDVPSSRYAPVSLAELRHKAPSVWLLGHVHKPTVLSEEPLILYPGSAQGLDPGEPGARGPWLLELDGTHVTKCEQLFLAPVRYDRLSVSLTGAANESEVRAKIIAGIREWHQQFFGELNHTSIVSLRLELSGETEILSAVRKLSSELPEEFEFSQDQVRYHLETITVSCTPPVRWEELARADDVPGLLAKRLITLRDRNPAPEYQRLLDSGRDAARRVQRENAFRNLNAGIEPEAEFIRLHLLEAGAILLGELLEQRQLGSKLQRPVKEQEKADQLA